MDEEILLIDKPEGMSSFGVVARVRRILSEKAGKRVKVGHAGTLDPFATGLLVLLIGNGTKRAEEFLKLDKEYEAELRLGFKSNTGDVEREIVQMVSEEAVTRVSEEEILGVMTGLIGENMQRVPNFSAVKIGGRRAYDLARKGVEVEMPVRKVQIYDIKMLGFEQGRVKFWCKVSSGTYIRALGEEIGEKLGVSGYLTGLRRLTVGKFDVREARKLGEFMGEDDE